MAKDTTPLQDLNKSAKCGMNSKQQIRLLLVGYSLIENVHRGQSIMHMQNVPEMNI